MANATAYDATFTLPRLTRATAYDATVRSGPVFAAQTATALAVAPFGPGLSASLLMIGDQPVYAVAAAFAPLVRTGATPIPPPVIRHPGIRLAAGAASAFLATTTDAGAEFDTARHAGLGLEAS